MPPSISQQILSAEEQAKFQQILSPEQKAKIISDINNFSKK
jgi:hypothetical protein